MFLLRTSTLLGFLFKLEGASSSQNGEAQLSNPYDAGTTQHAHWLAGWLEGQNAVTWTDSR